MRGWWLLLFPITAWAQQPEPEKPEDANKPKTGQVFTFYGLRTYEQDPKVSDDDKMKEWQAFIGRAEEQIAYAKKAVDRWKNAARDRVVETARQAEADANFPPADKIHHWREVVRLYPKAKEAQQAQKRIAHWTQEETRRRVLAAEDVERARATKVERIVAWVRVLEWIDKGPEVKAAQKRITDLQAQLFTEAQDVDRIARVDRRTKIEAWRDVINGRPTKEQRQKAERRLIELEAEAAAAANPQ